MVLKGKNENPCGNGNVLNLDCDGGYGNVFRLQNDIILNHIHKHKHTQTQDIFLFEEILT